MSRFFRCVLNNDIPGFRLQMAVPAHLCNGSWTPGGWRPPTTIDSGASGAWQSERDWYLAGTSGWVKYDILNKGDGSKRAQLVIYWTNPYLGATYAKRDIGASFTVADCDDEAPENSSAFAVDNARPEDLHLDVTAVFRDGTPSHGANPELLLPGNMLPTILLTGGIAERCEMHFRLTSTAPSTLLPAPKPKTKSLETKPAAANFAGDWIGANVSVRLALQGMGRFAVKVSDRTQPQALELESTAYLRNLNTAHLLTERATRQVGGNAQATPQSVQLLKQLGTAVDRKVAKVKIAPAWLGVQNTDAKLEKEKGKFINPASIARMGTAVGLANDKELVSASKAIAEQTRVASYALLLNPDIVVYLIRIQENGTLVGYELRYQRLSALGIPLVVTDLAYDLHIH